MDFTGYNNNKVDVENGGLELLKQTMAIVQVLEI